MHGGPKGHNGGGKNIYVAYFDTASGTLFTVGGTSLATVIDAADLDKTRVVTTNPPELPTGKDGTWTSTTVDTSTSLFKDLVATGDSVDFSYASADKERLVVKSWTPGGPVTAEHDLMVPYSAGADTTFYANFVENRPSDLVAGTIDYETRKTGHTGKWPVFSIRG